MGIATSETRAEDGVGRWSVLIYDKAPGGAGFSISASVHIEDLLRDAAKILACPNGTNCTTGCPGCVMCRDLEAHESIIDRLEALSGPKTANGVLVSAVSRGLLRLMRGLSFAE